MPRAQQAIGDDHLRRVPTLGFAGVPAVVGGRELGAHAMPARAGLADDVIAIDQVFAARERLGFRHHARSVALRDGAVGALPRIGAGKACEKSCATPVNSAACSLWLQLSQVRQQCRPLFRQRRAIEMHAIR